MHATGIRNSRTYKKAMEELEEFGFIIVIEKSQNQYTSTRIALVENTEAHTKARQKQASKQVTGIASINKPLNLKTLKPINGNHKKIEEELSEEEKPVEFMPEKLNSRVHKATKMIADFFKISEINQASHFNNIGRFVFKINKLGKLDHLSQQFAAYAELKTIKKGYTHSWQKWIGDQEDDYDTGVWNLENWPEKLKDQKEIMAPKPNINSPPPLKAPDYSKFFSKQQNQ
jgi:hypothetical protein